MTGSENPSDPDSELSIPNTEPVVEVPVVDVGDGKQHLLVDDRTNDALNQEVAKLSALVTPQIGDPGRQRSVRTDLLSDTPGRSDTIVDGGRFGPLEVRAVSLRGLSHRCAGSSKPRQDDYCLHASVDGRWLVIVVSDGVSNASHSHIGSTIVTRRSAELVVERLVRSGPDDIDWRDVLHRVNGYLIAEVRRRANDSVDPESIGPREAADFLAATGVMVIVDTKPETAAAIEKVPGSPTATEPADNSTSESAQFVETVPFWAVNLGGDSGVWCIRNSVWESLGSSKSNDGVEVGVRALPLAGTPVMVTGTLDRDAVLMVGSDGIGDPVQVCRDDVAVELAQAWAEPPEPLVFAFQASFFKRSFDDDRTAVGVWLRP